MRSSALIRSVAVCLLPVLGGCGGGGGPAAVAPPPACIPTHGGDCVARAVFERRAAALVDGYEREEGFRNQWGLAKVDAGRAWANIAVLKGPGVEPGAGVTLGFLDTGIDLDHPAFAGKTVTERFLPGATDETGSDTESHGTAVASVAAAGKAASSRAASGVAPGADIAMFAIASPSVGVDYIPVSLAQLDGYDDEMALYIDTVLTWRDGARRVDILNLSFGANGIIDDYTEQQLRRNFDKAIAAMAQAGAGEKTILVWGAGNAHGHGAQFCEPPSSDCDGEGLDAVSVEVFAGLAARIAELRGHTVAVAALRESDGRIASFSNRCGIAAAYCIAAPGDGMALAWFGPDLDAPDGSGTVRRWTGGGSGTSYAAPMVAGGLALMKQVFRGQLSNTELVTRLFATADKSGVYADRAVYGQGAMDLGAATSPVGVLEVPGVNTARGGARLTAMRFRPGPALGDGMARSLASREIMALDELGAPFWRRLGTFTAAAEGPSVAARLRGFLAGGPAGAAGAPGRAGPGRETAPPSLRAVRLDAPAEIRGSHLALAEGGAKATLAGRQGLSAAVFATEGLARRGPAVGASLSWRRAGWPVGLRAGWIGERETLLGSVGEGAFGALSADTSFLGVDAAADLGGWRIGANAELGLVAPAVRGGIVTGISSLTTSAFALRAARALADSGMLDLSASQPLRVENGRASLSLPAGRTREGAVFHSAARADLEPSGRQLDFSGRWRGPLAGGELRLGAVLSLQPGHRRAADPDWTFLGGWRRQF